MNYCFPIFVFAATLILLGGCGLVENQSDPLEDAHDGGLYPSSYVKLFRVGPEVRGGGFPGESVGLLARSDGSILATMNWTSPARLYAYTDRGELIWEKSYPLGAGFTFATESGLVLCGRDTVNGMWRIVLTDIDGEVVGESSFPSNASVSKAAFTTTGSGGAVLLNVPKNFNETVRNDLVEFGSAGQILWSRTYSDLFFNDIASVDGGGFVAAVKKEYAQIPNGRVARLDSRGDVLWVKSLLREDDYDLEFSQIHRLTDGEFLLSGEVLVRGEGRHRPRYVKLDSDGNVSWERSLQDGFASSIKLLRQTKTRLVIVAGSGYGPYVTIELDERGEIVNQYEWPFGFPSPSCKPYSFAQSASGSLLALVACGTMYRAYPQGTWVADGWTDVFRFE